MFSWFKKASTKFQKVSLPGQVGTFEIPEEFQVEFDGDDDSILMFFHPKVNDLTFRISSISGVPKDRSENGAFREVQSTANEHNAKVTVQNEKAWFQYKQDSEENGEALTLYFWQIGSLNTIVILSATILKASEGSAAVRSVLESVPRMIETLRITKNRHVIQDGDDEVSFTSEAVDPVPETRRELNSEEEKWLHASLSAAEELGRRYGSGGDLTPRELDVIYSRWFHEGSEKEPAELIVDALGAAFGQHLVEGHGFSWIVVSDQYGSDYAVQHPAGQTTSFPRSSVQKRIDAGAEGFFHPVYLTVLETLKRANEGGSKG